MATKLIDLPAGSAKPTSMVQFGGRTLVLYEDIRPIVCMPGPSGTMKAYYAGIKPPTTAPGLATGAASTIHRIPTDKARAAYCFYSEHRRVFSELSPFTSAVSFSGTKLVVNGFEAPRDTYSTQDITHVVIGIELESCPGGLLCLWDSMKVDCSDNSWTSASKTVDLSPDILRWGFKLHKAAPFFRVPPAFKFAAVHGERIWYSGHRTSAAKTGNCTTENTTWRGRAVCKLTLTSDTWSDADLYMAVYDDDSGSFLGYIWDVHSTTVAYLQTEVPAALDSQTLTGGITLKGVNDVIWPSSYHCFMPGNVPTVFPECVCDESRYRMPALSDEAQNIRGLDPLPNGVLVKTDDTPVLMTGALSDPNGEDDQERAIGPKPVFQLISAVMGSPAERGAAVSPAGEVAWLTTNGPMLYAGSGSIGDIGFRNGCSRLFRGEEWFTKASLQNAVGCYVRDFNGFLWADLEVGEPLVVEDGDSDLTTGYAVLFTTHPQVGFWVFSHLPITSNLLEYHDDNGESVILAGDGFGGRLKRLMKPGTLTKLPADSDTPETFLCLWRGGWESGMDAKQRPIKYVNLSGVIPPAGTFTVSRSLWKSNFPLRHPDDVTTSGAKETPSDLTQDNNLVFCPVSPGSYRYFSIGLEFESNTGASNSRPLEVARWESGYEGAKS